MRRRADVFLERENETRIEIFARGTLGWLPPNSAGCTGIGRILGQPRKGARRQ